jgi:hypothetical protein
MEEAIVSTELQRSIERGRLRLKTAKDIDEVAKAMVSETPAAVVKGDAQPFPAMPGGIDITPEIEKALTDLEHVFGRVQPKVRRTLNEAERAALGRELEVINTLKDLLAKRKDDIRAIVYAALDVAAERDGVADPASSPRDKDGHYVLGTPGKPSTYERMPIPDSNYDFVREARNPKVEYDEAQLDRMLQAGQITREQYLALTVEKRVFDKTKALLAIQKDPKLLSVFRQLLRAGRPSGAFFTRKRA